MPPFIGMLLIALIPSVGSAKAPGCTSDAAGYAFITEHWQSEKLQRRIPWEWIPGEGRALYFYPQTRIAEDWSVLESGRVRLERAFLDAQRGVSYGPADLRDIQAEEDWSQLRSPVSAALLARLHRTDTEGDGCQRIDTYAGRVGDTHYEIRWAAAGGYPQRLVSRRRDRVVRQRLARRLSAAEVAALQKALGEIDYVDYADVGDNEADPFVSRLIGLGFIEHGEHPKRVAYPGHDH